MLNDKEPLYVFKGPIQKGSFVFNGSEIHTFVVDLSSFSNEYEFKVYQNLPRQDFSVRMWISKEEKSLPVSLGNSIKNLNLRKFPINIRIIYSLAKGNNSYYTFNVDFKEVYVNFQNLENSVNGYRII